MYFFVHGLYLVFLNFLIYHVQANPTSKAFKPSDANATVTTSVIPSSGSPGCAANCTRILSEYYSIYWSPKPITATVTAETLLYVVNPRNNKTRTETITNTEADLSNYKKPNNTNSAGTQVTAVSSWDGSKTVTSLLTFPTAYTAYDEHYTITGILPTTVAGNPSCIRATGGAYPSYVFSVFTFPSHPPVPPPSPIPGAITLSATSDRVDPRGWTYSAVFEDLSCEHQDDLKPLFPDLGMWNCKPPLCAAPAEYHGTALYLTGTSFSTESDEPTATAAPSSAAPIPPVTASSAVAQPSPSIAAPTNKPAPMPAQSSAAGQSSVAVVAQPPPSNENHPVLSTPQVPQVPQGPQGTPVISAASAAPPASGSSPFSAANGQPAPIAPGSAGNSPSSATNGPPGIIAPLVPANSVSNAAKASPAPIVVNSQTFSVNAASQYLISSQTLIPGGSPVTLGSGSNAQTVAIQTSNAQQPVLVVGSSTSQLPQGPPALVPPTTLAPGPIVIGSQTVAPNSASQYVVASQTLAVGAPPITMGSGSSAQPVALQTSGSQTYLVVGSSTSLIQPSTATPTGIGGFVAGGFNGAGASSPPAAFTGGASLVHGRTACAVVGGLVGVVLMLGV